VIPPNHNALSISRSGGKVIARNHRAFGRTPVYRRAIATKPSRVLGLPTFLWIASRFARNDGGVAIQTTSSLASHPQRHQDVERRRAVAILDQGRRAGIGESDEGGVGRQLPTMSSRLAGVEADVDRCGIVVGLDLLARRALVGIVDRDRLLPRVPIRGRSIVDKTLNLRRELRRLHIFVITVPRGKLGGPGMY
jgi:hypothetical protein